MFELKDSQTDFLNLRHFVNTATKEMLLRMPVKIELQRFWALKNLI